jgi:hypothetical protein
MAAVRARLYALVPSTRPVLEMPPPPAPMHDISDFLPESAVPAGGPADAPTGGPADAPADATVAEAVAPAEAAALVDAATSLAPMAEG